MRKALLIAPLVAAFVLITAVPVLAADQIDQTLESLTTWLQGRLVALAVLALVVGGGLVMLGQEVGKRLMVGAIVGLLAVLLAKPIITAVAGMVTH